MKIEKWGNTLGCWIGRLGNWRKANRAQRRAMPRRSSRDCRSSQRLGANWSGISVACFAVSPVSRKRSTLLEVELGNIAITCQSKLGISCQRFRPSLTNSTRLTRYSESEVSLSGDSGERPCVPNSRPLHATDSRVVLPSNVVRRPFRWHHRKRSQPQYRAPALVTIQMCRVPGVGFDGV